MLQVDIDLEKCPLRIRETAVPFQLHRRESQREKPTLQWLPPKACFVLIITSNFYYLLSARHYIWCGIFLLPLGVVTILLLHISLPLQPQESWGTEKSKHLISSTHDDVERVSIGHPVQCSDSGLYKPSYKVSFPWLHLLTGLLSLAH